MTASLRRRKVAIGRAGSWAGPSEGEVGREAGRGHSSRGVLFEGMCMVASSTNFWGAEPLQKLCHVLPITVGTDGTYLPRFPIFFWSLDLEFQKLIAAAAAAKYR